MTPEEPVVGIRMAVVGDAETFASWATDEHFRRAAEWPADRSVDERVASLASLITDPPADLVRLCVEHEGSVVGYVDIQGEEPDRRELGYLVGPSCRWGRGLGLATARAGIRYGFEVMKLGAIWAEALDANAASVKILQRLGMEETGRGDDSTYLRRPTFYRQFSLDRTAWGIGVGQQRVRPLC